MEQLRWEEEWENVTPPFATLGVTSFDSSWVEEPETIAVGREVPALGRESACSFAGIPA